MARIRKSSAASFPPRAGAKPPSSPTPVESPLSFSNRLSVWKISTPIRRASPKLPAPAGTSMNSWMSRPLSACAPPLTTFMSGTGRRRAPEGAGVEPDLDLHGRVAARVEHLARVKRLDVGHGSGPRLPLPSGERVVEVRAPLTLPSPLWGQGDEKFPRTAHGVELGHGS